MIIITKVETITVDRDPYEVLHQAMPNGFCTPDLTAPPMECEVFSELIHGMRWRWHDRDNDIDIIVGVSGEAEKILNLGYGIVENLKKETNRLDDLVMMQGINIKDQTKTIKNLRDASFWQRFKWVFTGVTE